MLKCRDKLRHFVGECAGVDEESECETDCNDAECAQSPAAIKVDCGGADAERERNAELVEVPPWSAPDDQRAEKERRANRKRPNGEESATCIAGETATIRLFCLTTAQRPSE